MLSSIVLLNQDIDFYQMKSECYYKDIAYVVASSGKEIFYKNVRMINLTLVEKKRLKGRPFFNVLVKRLINED